MPLPARIRALISAAWEDGFPLILATGGPDGAGPGPKGSLIACDGRDPVHLACGERAAPRRRAAPHTGKKNLAHVILFAALLAAFAARPAAALDLNSYRAQHGRPALSVSASLSALAYQQAHAMAGREKIDHRNFRQRIGASDCANRAGATCGIGSTHAENVSYGCEDEDCAIRQWSRSGGHRANMLRGDVSAYGIASATGENGRKYWALELGGE